MSFQLVWQKIITRVTHYYLCNMSFGVEQASSKNTILLWVILPKTYLLEMPSNANDIYYQNRCYFITELRPPYLN